MIEQIHELQKNIMALSQAMEKVGCPANSITSAMCQAVNMRPTLNEVANRIETFIKLTQKR